MKDSNDKATKDMLNKSGRGRPSTGKAMTDAQKQKAYRARKKASGEYQQFTLHRDERELLIELVHACWLEEREKGNNPSGCIKIANLGRRLEALRR